MRRHLTHFLLVAMLTVCSAATAFAQITVRGQVVDADSGEPLIGAAITVEGTTQGSITDIDGNFTQSIAPNATLVIRYLGYKDYTKKITGSGTVNLGKIELSLDAVALADVTITSSIAVARKTPVAMSTVDPIYIEERLGTQEFPEILKSTPGVYVSQEGGGFGDSSINMRGFKSENVAVMVNGIPMNDMEWGGLYWSNWAGLTDVTRSMQTQRGLGASKVSAPSVGGSINIVTKTIDAQKGGAVSYGIGQDGYNKFTFSVSTGMSEKGWAMSLLGGKSWGDGYVQGTEFEMYNWFFNVAKRINDNHQISFTGFGAPQWHNQRSSQDGLTIEGWQTTAKQYMEPGDEYRYNPTYGFGKHGERKTSSRNKYHKPQFSLNHMWDINYKSSLSTALYLSLGDGYGYSGQTTSAYSSQWYGSTNGILNTYFRNADGTFAYDQIQEMNERSTNGSEMVMSVSKNQHTWYGLLSTYTTEVNDRISLYAGVDGRYYIGTHTNEIIDLYNGEYYVDRYRRNVKAVNNAAANESSWVNQKLGVGDVVYRDYDGHVLQGGIFGQGEYTDDKLSTFVSAAVNYTSQWRYDRFYYDKEHAKSAKVNKPSFNIKGGLNYNLNEYHNVFGNIGYISRAPFFSGGAFLQAVSSNQVNKDAVNEKIFSVELGYGFQSRYFSANLNIYHTKWMDKTTTGYVDRDNEEGISERFSMNMEGVNAIHQGIEVDFVSKPVHWLKLSGMFSIGNWRWVDSAIGYYYDEGGQPVNASYGPASGIKAEDHLSAELIFNGVKVGGSAQTTASLSADFYPTKDIRLGIDWNLFARNYANWSPSSTVNPGSKTEYEPVWRIPSASTFDLSASYSFHIGPFRSTLSGNVTNLFNQEYINNAYDGSDHTWQTAYRVYYGIGRQMSMRLKVNF
ncbi:MAG: carboxypeptidase-like regulatory domain-containing protein [Bacteroides sp.]|nr:carboxypeptidase-like regulatory domain-containing protein [Bacteroides sp.]